MSAPSLQLAMSFFHSGQAGLAEVECRKLLAANPKHGEAAHLLGVILLQAGRTKEALEPLEAALRAKPSNHEAALLYGQALAMLGDIAKAHPYFERVSRAQPKSTQALYNFALSSAALGHHEAARKSFAKLLAADPVNVRYLMGQGASMAVLGRFDEAAQLFDKAARLAPGAPEILEQLAMARLDAGETDKARDALNAIPESARTGRQGSMLLLGRVAFMDERFDDAAQLFLDALNFPNSFSSQYAGYLKASLFRAMRWEELLCKSEVLSKRYPNKPEAAFARGYLLYLLERPDDALSYLQRARDLSFDQVTVDALRAACHADLGCLNTSVEILDSLSMQPGATHLSWDKGIYLLAAGRLDEGWPLFRARLSLDPFAGDRCFPLDSVYAGDASGLAGKSVTVWKEQGVGDELSFYSALPDLLSLANGATVLCSPKLHPLLARSFPKAEILSLSAGAAQHAGAKNECRVPAGDLFCLFRPSINHFPSRASYLTPDPVRVDAWRSWLDSLGSGRKIGISWTSTWSTRQRLRYLFTSLSAWGPILELKDTVFISLQPKHDPAHIEEAERLFGCKIHIPLDLDQYDDIDGVAALIANLDAVVSVATLVAVLSGALGVPVATFIDKSYSWDCLGSDGVPWLPSLRIFERKIGGDWSPAIQQVSTWLCSGPAGG